MKVSKERKIKMKLKNVHERMEINFPELKRDGWGIFFIIVFQKIKWGQNEGKCIQLNPEQKLSQYQ